MKRYTNTWATKAVLSNVDDIDAVGIELSGGCLTADLHKEGVELLGHEVEATSQKAGGYTFS